MIEPHLPPYKSLLQLSLLASKLKLHEYTTMSTEFLIEIGVDGENRGEVILSSHTDTATHDQPDDKDDRPELVRQDSTRSEL